MEEQKCVGNMLEIILRPSHLVKLIEKEYCMLLGLGGPAARLLPG